MAAVYFVLPLLGIKLYNSNQQFFQQCICIAFFSVIFILLLNYFYTKKLTEKRAAIDAAVHRYEALSSATNDAIWDFDIVTGQVFHNDMLLQIFGYTNSELADNTNWWENNIHNQDRDRVITNMNNSLQSNANHWEDEYRFKCKDGSYKIIYDRSHIIRDKNGKPIRLIGAMKDVTRLRSLEKELINKQLKKKTVLGQKIIASHEHDKKRIKDLLQEDVNQILASIKLYIKQYQLENENSDTITASVSYLDDAMKKIKNISDTLSNSTFEIFGLKEAIYFELISKYQQNDIALELDAADFNEDKSNTEINLLLFQIIDAILELIVDNTQAKNITIKLVSKENFTRLNIYFQTENKDVLSILQSNSMEEIWSKLDMYEGTMKMISGEDNNYSIEVIV